MDGAVSVADDEPPWKNPEALGHWPRVALVGCGIWGGNIARTLAGLGVLGCVIDKNRGAAERLGRQFDVKTVEFETALADPSLEAFVLAAPAQAQVRLACAALEAGRHVAIEKPVAMSIADIDALAAAAPARVVMAGHLLQYHEAFRALLALKDTGALGPLRWIQAERRNLGRVRTGLSALWDLAAHDVSMVLAVAGTLPEAVAAHGEAWLCPGSPDSVVIHLRFAGKLHATIAASWVHPFKEHRFIVGGAQASAIFDDTLPWRDKLRLVGYRFDELVSDEGERYFDAHSVALAPPVPRSMIAPLEMECRSFLDCVRDGTRAPTDLAESRRVTRVLLAGEASLARKGEWIPP